MSYYEDDEKITFDRAHALVRRFIREKSEMRSRVCSRHVARQYDIEQSRHNLLRINDALDEQLEKVQHKGSQATTYKLPDEE